MIIITVDIAKLKLPLIFSGIDSITTGTVSIEEFANIFLLKCSDSHLTLDVE